jgi:hypothetical protein
MPVVGSTAYPQAREVNELIRGLMNDANIGANAPVFVASISRAGGVVTVTTIGPHGLLAGVNPDQATVAGVPVGANSFNGVFPVASVIGPTQYTYAQAGANEAAAAGTSSAVGLGAVWTDAVLMRYTNSGYRKVRRAVSNVGKPTLIRDDVLLVVPAIAQADPSLQVSITDSTAPPNQLPVDLLEVLKIWERPNGSSQEFMEMDDLTNKGGLPSRNQEQTLDIFEFRGDGIYFLGATQDTQIRLRYKAGFVNLTDGSSVLLLRDCQEAVAFTTAAIIGASRGSPFAEKWDTAAVDAIEDLILDATRQNQRRPTRRRPFSSRSGFSPF